MSDGPVNVATPVCAKAENLNEQAATLRARLDELYALLGRTAPSPQAMAMMDRFELTAVEAEVLLTLRQARPGPAALDALSGHFPSGSAGSVKVGIHKLSAKLPGAEPIRSVRGFGYWLADEPAAAVEQAIDELRRGWQPSPQFLNDRRRRRRPNAVAPTDVSEPSTPPLRRRRGRNTAPGCVVNCSACNEISRQIELLQARIAPLEGSLRRPEPPSDLTRLAPLMAKFQIRTVSARILLRLFCAAPSFVTNSDLLEGQGVGLGSLRNSVHQIRAAVGEQHVISGQASYRISDDLRAQIAALLPEGDGHPLTR